MAEDVAPRPGAGANRGELAALEAASHAQRLDAAVDLLVGEWADAVPGLDTDVRAISARIARIDDRLRERKDAVLAKLGLSDNEFRLLAGLIRIGPPHRCAPRDLAGRYVPVTSGGLTGISRKLQQRGLIDRVAHPHDQRSVPIALTREGEARARDAMAQVAAAEEELMAGLTAAQRQRGNDLLRKLLHSIERALP
jgi:DNA-binding MarR family transcriptional regulator